MSAIRFKAKLFKIGSESLVRLPESASVKLPSRGMAMVEGTINGFGFQAALEPDGKGSHWLRVDRTMREAAGADAGGTVRIMECSSSPKNGAAQYLHTNARVHSRGSEL